MSVQEWGATWKEGQELQGFFFFMEEAQGGVFKISYFIGFTSDLVTLWLRLCVPNAGGMSSFPGWGRSCMPCGVPPPIKKKPL